MFHVEHDCTVKILVRMEATHEIRVCSTWNSRHPQRSFPRLRTHVLFHVELTAPTPGDPRPREPAARSGESGLDPSTTSRVFF